MQVVLELHDTSISWVSPEAIDGAQATVHFSPFQCSITGFTSSPCWYHPAATHQTADVHDTLVSTATFASSSGSGTSTLDHCSPSQCSASSEPGGTVK